MAVGMTVYELLEHFVGTPPNDYAALALYMMACIIGTLFVYFVLYIIKIFATLPGGSR
jgi:hypothetical protein